MGTRLLSPDPERPGTSPPVTRCGHQMTPWPEVPVDHAVCREEVLRLLRRLEPLHLPLSSSRRPVRVLSTIVEIPAGAMPDRGQNGPLRDTIATQPVGDEAPWLILQSIQQALEEALGSRAVSPLLHQDVQHHTVLINRAPQIMQRAVYAKKDLIKMPGVARPRPSSTQSPGKRRAELAAPVADALVANHHATLGQDQLDVAQTEAEDVIQPHRVADDLSRKAMAVIQAGLWRHPVSFACRRDQRQP